MSENTPPDESANEPRPSLPIPPMPPITPGEHAESAQRVELRVPLFNGLPPQQPRWTILLRILLAIPQFVILIFVLIGVEIATIVAWFAALITGRVPTSLRNIIEIGIRWSTRVSAYVYLLTAEYPGFNGDADPDYPIGVEFPDAQPLNRFAVLFRLVVAAPMVLVLAIFAAGINVFLFVFWISALILGRLPDPVYRVIAVYLRFSARLSAYYAMLTPEYPWGWKGDAATASSSNATVTAMTSTDTYWDRMAVHQATPVANEASHYDFTLAGWARGWLWIFLVVGAVYESIYFSVLRAKGKS